MQATIENAPATPGAAPAVYVNIAAYKFITLDKLDELRPQYQEICARLGLKGTILLTPEGINMFLSGTRGNIDEYLATGAYCAMP